MSVRGVSRALVTISMARAAFAGVAVGVLIAAIGGGDVPAWASGLVVASALVWYSRGAWSLERAALWVEERDPALQYALVTSVDARYAGRPAPAYSGPLLRRAAVRSIGPAVLALGVAIVVSHLLAAHHFRAGERHVSGDASGRGATRTVNRLTPLTAHVTPPAYSHQPSRDLAEPSSVASLVGSAIVLRGRGDTAGIRATMGSVASDGSGWQVSLTMPDKPALVRLSDGVHDRLVVLAPVPDAPPVVELAAPARDSVMREAHGVLPLEARATDDIGLADGHFEIIVTNGSEESGGVQAKTVTVGAVGFQDARAGTMSAGFALDSLTPGDVVSIRAIVRDGNTVSGPGVGTSETRTYRLATQQEYDSIAVEGAPPPGIDSSYMSQRMIVMATRTLLGRMGGRHPVVRDTVVAVSRKLGDREDELSSKVSRILRGQRRGEGEAMSVGERVLFDTAYASMTDAAMSLAIAEAKEALPRELVALAALDSIRKMQHRLYLRGKPPTIVVNLALVRMKGTEKADAGPWTAGTATARDSVRRRLVASLGALVGGPASLGRPSVADSLTVMQVDALAIDPALAGAIGEAATAVRTGKDPRPALARARRMVSGAATVDTARVEWAGS